MKSQVKETTSRRKQENIHLQVSSLTGRSTVSTPSNHSNTLRTYFNYLVAIHKPALKVAILSEDPPPPTPTTLATASEAVIL